MKTTKTLLKYTIGSYESLVKELNEREANLFNMEQVHPLSIAQSEELYCIIPTMLKVYGMVITDLKRLL